MNDRPAPFDLVVSGSRHGATEEQWLAFRALAVLFASRGADVLRHGCALGLDERAALLGKALALRVVAHPGHLSHWTSDLAMDASDEVLPALRNKDRNAALAAHAARGGVLLACPAGRERDLDQLRSGTWQTARIARSLRAPVAVILPDGSCDYSDWDRLPGSVPAADCRA